jgi:hypothetical protein
VGWNQGGGGDGGGEGGDREEDKELGRGKKRICLW